MEDMPRAGGQPPVFSYFSGPKWFYAVIAASMIVAGGLRVLLYTESRGSPLTATHNHDLADMGLFHNWAVEIAKGDWTGAKTFHVWLKAHDVWAEKYFQLRPGLLPEMEAKAKASGKSVSHTLWLEWMGGEQIFEKEPLYSYLMAVIYALFGPDPEYIFIAQMILGVATIPLIIVIARRLFGENAAVFAAPA